MVALVALCGQPYSLASCSRSLSLGQSILREYPATGAILLLSAVPYLVAGAMLNVPSAVLVGVFAGLGRVLGQTGGRWTWSPSRWLPGVGQP